MASQPLSDGRTYYLRPQDAEAFSEAVRTHPETGRPIRQRVTSRLDFNHQLTLDRCFIEYDDEREDFPMTGRWMFKAEFQLLLRLAGAAILMYVLDPERRGEGSLTRIFHGHNPKKRS